VALAIAQLPEDRVELHPVEAGLERILTADLLGEKAARSLPTPQVFYVDMVDPHSRINPHFHGVDQFQLVVRGGGTLGKIPVAPGAFHYADAFQPYGPIAAGEEGLAYLTIRARHDTGAHYMPGGSRFRTGRPRRSHFVVAPDLRHRANETLAGPHEDGLRVDRLVVTKEGVDVAAAVESDGVVGVVLDGGLYAGGTTYGRWSCFAIPAGACERVLAIDGGADVLVLQFPRPAIASDANG